MTSQLNIHKNIYLYGKFYQYDGEFKDSKKKFDIIIYTNPKMESRAIGSLEGVFITGDFLSEPYAITIKRDEMENFVKQHQGQFLPL